MFDDLVSEENLTGPQKQSSQKKGLFSDLIETPSVKEELVGPPMSLAGPQAMIRKMSAGPSPIEKPVAEPTQIPLSGFRPPVIEEPMRLTAGKPSDIKKTKPENWKYYSPIEKFTYNLEENKLSEIADRFSKQFINSWSRVGQSITTHPFSPIGQPQEEVNKYFNQAWMELRSSGDLPTKSEIEQRASELAAMKKFPTMAVEPRKDKYELAADVAAGLSSFVVQLALLKKIMPSNTPDAIVWEAQNQITGGTPGEGAAMRLTLGQIGKIPTGKLSGKLAKVGLESSLFAGYSYLLGGDLDEIIISAMIPVTFNAYSFAQMKNHITKYESQLRNDALSAHQRRLQTGMNPATSNAYLKADLRKVDTWVAKAKQKIYQDDAFAPAREKWETIRQNAYKDLGKGGKKAQAAQRVIDWMESQPGGGQQPPTERPIEIKPPITITRPAVGEEALARAKATTIGQPPPVMPQQAPKAVKPAIPEISPTLPVTPGIAQEAPQKPVERRTIPEAPEAKQQEIVQPVTPVTPEKPSKKEYEITQEEIAPIFAKAQANGINANTVINTFQKEFTGVVQNKQEALLAYNMLAEGRTPLEIKTELSYNRKQAENVILPPKEEKISEVWKPKEETPEQAPQEEIAPEIETEKQNVKEDMIQVDRWQTKEFSEGKNAALRDKGENPYSENSIQWKTWNEGWNSVEPEKMGTIKESQEAPQKPSEVAKEPIKKAAASGIIPDMPETTQQKIEEFYKLEKSGIKEIYSDAMREAESRIPKEKSKSYKQLKNEGYITEQTPKGNYKKIQQDELKQRRKKTKQARKDLIINIMGAKNWEEYKRFTSLEQQTRYSRYVEQEKKLDKLDKQKTVKALPYLKEAVVHIINQNTKQSLLNTIDEIEKKGTSQQGYDWLKQDWYAGAKQYVTNKLRNAGFVRTHKSEKDVSGSVYYSRYDNKSKEIMIRISDHQLPDSPARTYYRDELGRSSLWQFEIVLDDIISESEIDKQLKEFFEEYKSEPWAQEALQQAPQKPSEVVKEPTEVYQKEGEKAKESISDILAEKKSTTIGTMIDTKDGRKIKMRLVPDTSSIGQYSVVISHGGHSQTIRMMYEGGKNFQDAMKHFEEYMNVDEPGRFTFDLISKPKPKIEKAKPSGFIAEKKTELKQLKSKQFKTRPDEINIERIEKQLKENVGKWQVGQGVGWRVHGKQINRGMRIIEVYPEQHKAKIQFIKDVGQLADYKHGSTHTVDMIDLIRDKNYDTIEPTVETKAKPTEKVKQPVEGNWKLGQERPFKFDANSTKNEGRFRLYPPELITGKYRSQTSIKSRNIPETPGVRFLLSKTKDGKSVIQTIRFDKSMFTEEQAAKWWNENKDRFEFYKPQKAEVESKKVIPAKSVKKEEKLKVTLPSEKIPPNQPIQDFGEKIGGARKDYYAMLEKAKDYSIAEHPLSKTFPAPDYQKLIDSGSDPYIVGLVRAMRDEIPSKPQSKWKLNRWIQQVELLRQFAEDLLNEKITKEVFNEKIKTKEFKNLLGPIVGRAELYEIVGHDVSLKGVSFSKHHYSIYRGEENVDKWVVEKKQKATAFSNWPRELAVGNTREEAIANFIEKYKTLKDEDNKSAKIKFTIYSYRKTPGIYWIGKKIGRNVIDLKQFNLAKEAREYRDKNYEELLKLLEKAKYIPEERRAINEQRKGPDHRKGKNVTPEMFTEAFGFRGVEFGNWVAKKGERQKALNDAYDALMDLAMILNIPSQAISLNGELALAFGARGKGGKRAAAAHYEPDRVVINLTRKMGPGSLAHEWWHALDNYFSRRRGKKMGYMTESPYGITDFTKIRKAMWEAFWAIDDAYKKTDIVKRSKELDKRRSTPYWSQSLEITARLFENYVIESLAEKGYSNDYLSNIVAQKEYMSDLAETLLAHQEITAMDVYPYLTEDEKKIVIPAYKKFFNTIEVKQVPGKIYASIGASKSPELDRALQRAAKKTKTSYVVQKNGKWIVSSQKPQYGDYYLISANESSLVKGETKFAEKDEAVKAARYMAKSKNGPVYIQKTEKGFILSEQKPSAEHIKIMPASPGLTKAEREYLGKRAQTVIKKAQEKGEKVGFKAGRAEAIKEARQKLDRFMMAVKLTDQLRRDAAEIVKEYIPKELQYRYIKRILEAKTNKRIDNLTKAMNLYLDRAEKKAARKDFVNFIKQTKRKYGRGEVPFGKLRNDVRQELIKVLELYDTMKLSGEKKEELESRDEYIKRIAGTVADAFESLEDMGKDILQMPSARIEELDRLRKIHIGELDADQIRYIQSSLDHLIKIAERKGDIKNRIKAEKLGKLINTARQEIHDKSKKPGVTTELTGVLGLVPRALSTAQATPHTLTGYITGKDNKATMEIINDNLVNMTKDKNNIIKNFVESYRKMLKDAGLTQADEKLLDEKIQIKYGGKPFSSDIDNLLGIYMDIRAEGNLQRILKAGRVFDVYHRDPKWGYIVRHTKIRTGRPGLEELREITDFVENKNPKLKKMADLYFKHNFEIQTPQVNKISMEYQNYELARKGKYWHMSRVMPLGIEGKKTDISISIENQGRFLPRTGGRQPFRNITFRQGVISNLQANAAYSAMTIPMQDIKALISDKRWQDTIIRNGLEKELKTLVVMLRRTQGMITSQDFIDLFGAKVLNNFGKYALSLRLSGYGVQTASIPAAFEIIEPKYFIAPRSIANLPRIPIKDVKEMMELSPTLWMRWTLRQFDYAIGSVASQNAYHNLLWSEKSPTEKLLNHYTWGDQKAIYQIYLAAQEKMAAETKLKRGTQEFKEAAIKITEDALETQPQWDMIYRNELTSSPNVLLRGSLMFQSARNAQYNVLLRAVDDYKKGRIGPGEAGKRISGVVYANILVAVVKRLIKIGIFFGALGLLYLISDEKEKKEKIKRTFRTKAGKVPGQVAIDSALNFISLPAFGSLTQNIAYETIQRIKYPNMKKDLQDIRTGNIFTDLTLDVTGLVADTGLMTKYLITGEKFKSGKDEGKPKWKRSAIEVADQLAELIAIRTGLPYSAPKGEIYYQIRSAEKSIEKTMSDRELIIAFKKTKTKNGVVKKGMEKKNRELYEEIQKRKKQRQ